MLLHESESSPDVLSLSGKLFAGVCRDDFVVVNLQTAQALEQKLKSLATLPKVLVAVDFESSARAHTQSCGAQDLA